MIDIENDVFNHLYDTLIKIFPNIYVTGETIRAPMDFPCVSVIEKDNTLHLRTLTDSEQENHAFLMYQTDIYSNKTNGKKHECKSIAEVVDETFTKLGFIRIMMSPVDNPEDTSIYRITCRYRAVVSKENIIYRR